VEHYGDRDFGEERFGHTERYANADDYYYEAPPMEPVYGHGQRMVRAARQFFGIGPKGYRVADEVIHEKAAEAMTADPELDPSDIEIAVSGGIVTLRGTVESRWMKRRAEDCVDGIYGVEDVRNELEIRRRQGGTAQDEQLFTSTLLPGTTASGGFNNTVSVNPELREGEAS
jgi:hypothetical protein